MGIIGAIIDFFRQLWSWIAKLIVGIINFFKNIVSWFKEPHRLAILKRNRKILSVAIKEKLGNGDYGIVNCLFDDEKNDIVGEYSVENQHASGVEGSSLDAETQKNFGDKEMIILK